MAADSSTLYLRLPRELKTRVQHYATKREGGQLTDAAIDLIACGLAWHDQARERIEAKQERAALEQEFAAARAKIDNLERELSTLASKLGTAEMLREMAEGKLADYYMQIQAFNYWLSVPIARCKDCNVEASFRHVAAAQCPTSQRASQGYEFLPQYQGQKDAGEIIRDFAAVVGAASVLVALS